MTSTGPDESPDFHRAMHDAADRSEMTWADIGAQLALRGHHIDAGTLRSWCYGGAVPTTPLERTAVPALERVLSLPPRHLSVLLAPLPPAPAQPTMLRPADASDDLYTDLANRLGRSPRPAVRTVDFYATVTIGPQRELQINRVRHLVMATTTGPTGLVIWYESEGPQGTPYLEPLRNCHIGTVVDLADRALLAYDLRFDHPLALGDTAYLEYESGCIGPIIPETFWEHSTMTPLRQLHVEVQFSEGVYPRHLEAYESVGGQERTAPAEVGATGSVSMLRLDFGPGAAGIRWTW